MTNLADFLSTNTDKILAEWEAFARTLLPSAATMDSLALRDHAKQILQAIAKDITTAQSPREQAEKSTDDTSQPLTVQTAAAIHGALRHTSGFDLRQLVAEYRALRASVLRLWEEHHGTGEPNAVYQMTRFNEAIDQALAESVAHYSDGVNKSRDTFLAILGHDLRSPLRAVTVSAAALADPASSANARAEAVASIQNSALSMSQMVRDLLEYTRSNLGAGIPLELEGADLGQIISASVAEVQSGYPQRSFRIDTESDLTVRVDAPRMQQAITNLLINAVQHGNSSSPVELVARHVGEVTVVQVKNRGARIPANLLQAIFDPVVQVEAVKRNSRHSASLGLGLFIAREITQGHGGTIEAESSDEATTFTISIPPQANGGQREEANGSQRALAVLSAKPAPSPAGAVTP